MAVIQELNFQPNALAQALAAGQSLTVGVLTQDITRPFFASISRGIQEGLSGSGYAVLFAESNWAMSPRPRLSSRCCAAASMG